MKKLALTLASSVVGLGTVLSASAQDYDTESKADRRFYLSPMATYSIYDNTRGFDDAIGYHLNIGKILGRGANLEIQGHFADPDFDGIDGNAELLGYGINVLLFQWRDTLPLYAVLGLAKSEAKNPAIDGKATADQFDIGLGYMLGLGNWPLVGNGPALRMEARYRYDKFDGGEAENYNALFGTGTEQSYHDTVLGLGLYIPLGADPNAEEEVAEPKSVTQIVIPATDSDGDLIPDDMDACPGTPPGTPIDTRGCERDSDGDGVGNSKDRCHNTPAGSPVNEEGCPPDDDADGVLNPSDQCPNTPAGLRVMSDGCALKGDCRVPNPGQRIDERGCAAGAVILNGVNFEHSSAELTSEAKDILDSVASALRDMSNVSIEIGGHTDSVGRADYNKALSKQRAQSVKRYLEQGGVSSDILTAIGYGESRPIASNEDEVGRQANRRVELKVAD